MVDEGIKQGIYIVSSRILHRISARDSIMNFLQTLTHLGCLISALNNNIKGIKVTMNCEKINIPTFNI